MDGAILLDDAKNAGEFPGLMMCELDMARRWLVVEQGEIMKSLPPGDYPLKLIEGDESSLSVLTFNALADGLPVPKHRRRQKEVFDWDMRKEKVLAAASAWDADIVCVQELNHFEDFMQPEMKKKGYSGSFIAKLASPASKFGFPDDGCAVFVKESKFHRIASKGHVLCTGTHVYQVVYLSRKFSFDAKVPDTIVITIHLKSKAHNESIRQSQMREIVAEVNRLQQVHPQAVIILAGDFNSETSGDSIRLLKSATKLENAYEPLISGSFNFMTRWKKEKKEEDRRIIDHIFSLNTHSVIAILNSPDEASLPDEGIPSKGWPSDHFSIMAILKAPLPFALVKQ